MLPSEFIERLRELYPDKAEAILRTFETKRPTTFRVNTLNSTVAIVQDELRRAGFELEPVEWMPLAFIVRNKSLRELTEQSVYTEGKIYVQGLSSMIPPLLIDPQKGEEILDVAAAPGSKTTQMAALMDNRGHIQANDTSLVRLFKLKANLETQGVTIVTTSRGLGQDLWQQYPEHFDRVLVDVPCSMEGRFLVSSPKTYANWSPKKNKELSLRQRALLRSAVSATKPGGLIVYSTCTLSVQENEEVVDWLLKREQGSVVVEPITELSTIPASPAILRWKHKHFDESLADTLRILPTDTMEGFYVAKLRKIRSTVPLEIPFSPRLQRNSHRGLSRRSRRR